MNSIKNYYLGMEIARRAKINKQKSGESNELVSNLWALFTGLEMIQYSSRNLRDVFTMNLKANVTQILNWSIQKQKTLAALKLKKSQQDEMLEGVQNSGAIAIEALGYCLTVPDTYMDEFLAAIENKSKELQTRFNKEQEAKKKEANGED